MAQWLEDLAASQEIVRSIPTGSLFPFPILSHSCQFKIRHDAFPCQQKKGHVPENNVTHVIFKSSGAVSSILNRTYKVTISLSGELGIRTPLIPRY